MKYVVHACNFSGAIDELPRRKQGQLSEVLKVLHKNGRFSEFEASANSTIAGTMTALVQMKLITIDNSMGYPWSKATLTEAGVARMGQP